MLNRSLYRLRQAGVMLAVGLCLAEAAFAERITFVKSGDIHAMTSLTATPAQITALGSVMDHRISPDGSQIAFSSTVVAGDSYEVHVMSADGGPSRKIATKTQGNHGWGYGLAFSPDGRYVLYSSGDGLWKVGVDGAGKTLIAANPANRTWRELDWHANGKILAMSTGGWAYDAEIRLMDEDGGNQTIVVANDRGGLQAPRFSPDGQSFLYTYDVAGNEEYSGRQTDTSVFVQALTGGSPTNLSLVSGKPSGTRDWRAAFSPDGSRILVIPCSDAGCTLAVMNRDGAQRQTLISTPLLGDVTLDWNGTGTAALPVALSITASATLQSAGRTQLAAMVAYADYSSKAVTPIWSSSNPAVATVSASGELAAGSVSADTPVTIGASYSENGATVTVSRTITISAAPASLSAIAIAGGNTVASGGLLRLRATATYADGSSRDINPAQWTLTPATLGTINTRGELTVNAVTADTPLTVTASHSEGGIAQTASIAVTVTATPAALSSLGLVLPKGTLASGESMTLAAESGYADGSGKRVMVAWTLSDTTIASIAGGGVLTAHAVAQDTPLVITASYSEGGRTLTARYSVIILAAAAPPQLTAEVIATLNAQNQVKLKLWFNTDVGATTRAKRAGKTYRVYVAALVPTGPLVGTPTYFLLNRSKTWQALSWPLAEYLSGVNQGDWQLLELLDGVDTSLIAGAQILVGYGESDTEMLEAGRYSEVYRIP